MTVEIKEKYDIIKGEAEFPIVGCELEAIKRKVNPAKKKNKELITKQKKIEKNAKKKQEKKMKKWTDKIKKDIKISVEGILTS